MKRFTLIAALLLVSVLGSFVRAGTGASTGTWAFSTSYSDNSPLAPSEIVGSDIDCTFTPPGGVATPCVFTPTTVAGNATSFSIQLTYPSATGGRACFRTRTRTTNAVSALSPLGAASCKDFAAVTPNAPGAVTVTVSVSVIVTP